MQIYCLPSEENDSWSGGTTLNRREAVCYGLCWERKMFTKNLRTQIKKHLPASPLHPPSILRDLCGACIRIAHISLMVQAAKNCARVPSPKLQRACWVSFSIPTLIFCVQIDGGTHLFVSWSGRFYVVAGFTFVLQFPLRYTIHEKKVRDQGTRSKEKTILNLNQEPFKVQVLNLQLSTTTHPANSASNIEHFRNIALAGSNVLEIIVDQQCKVGYACPNTKQRWHSAKKGGVWATVLGEAAWVPTSCKRNTLDQTLRLVRSMFALAWQPRPWQTIGSVLVCLGRPNQNQPIHQLCANSPHNTLPPRLSAQAVRSESPMRLLPHMAEGPLKVTRFHKSQVASSKSLGCDGRRANIRSQSAQPEAKFIKMHFLRLKCKIGGFLTNARQMATRCFCPPCNCNARNTIKLFFHVGCRPDKRPPRGPTCVSHPWAWTSMWILNKANARTPPKWSTLSMKLRLAMPLQLSKCSLEAPSPSSSPYITCTIGGKVVLIQITTKLHRRLAIASRKRSVKRSHQTGWALGRQNQPVCATTWRQFKPTKIVDKRWHMLLVFEGLMLSSCNGLRRWPAGSWARSNYFFIFYFSYASLRGCVRGSYQDRARCWIVESLKHSLNMCWHVFGQHDGLYAVKWPSLYSSHRQKGQPIQQTRQLPIRR